MQQSVENVGTDPLAETFVRTFMSARHFHYDQNIAEGRNKKYAEGR